MLEMRLDFLRRDAGNVDEDTSSKTALAVFSASDEPTGVTLMS